MYGTAAIPSTESNAKGNVGTIATCNAQGFIIFSSYMTSLFYYCSLSCYSFVGVLNNFHDSLKVKRRWLIVCIHVLIHIYPIGSALSLLFEEAYNNSGLGFCAGFTSSPLGCSFPDSVTPCERGPGNQRPELLRMIPLFLFLLFPTSVMIFLCYKVKQRQDEIFIDVKAVAKQSVVYLSPLFWTTVPFLIAQLMIWNGNSWHDAFGIAMFGTLNISLFGFWTMIVYLYFYIGNNNSAEAASESMNENSNHDENINSSQAKLTASGEEIKEEANPAPKTKTGRKSRFSRAATRFSFNIFDGANATGAFANFIYDGDSDDERVDNEQTVHWKAVQDHI